MVAAKDAARVSEPCRVYLQQLVLALRMLVPAPGKAGASRKTVKAILMHWGHHAFTQLYTRQQLTIRALQDVHTRISLDHTYKAASTLGAADCNAKTVHGKSKLARLQASLLTCLASFGLVLFVALVPSDGQEHALPLVSALWGADTNQDGESEYQTAVRQHVEVGGRLQGLPDFIGTDYVVQQKNFWAHIASVVIDACREYNTPIYIPEGVAHSFSLQLV